MRYHHIDQPYAQPWIVKEALLHPHTSVHALWHASGHMQVGTCNVMLGREMKKAQLAMGEAERRKKVGKKVGSEKREET